METPQFVPGMTYLMYPGVSHLGLIKNNDLGFTQAVSDSLPPFGILVDDQSLCPPEPEPEAP